MALINCPECGGKVSDAATVCIHCGYPLQDESNKYCEMLGIGKTCDLSDYKRRLLALPEGDIEGRRKIGTEMAYAIPMSVGSGVDLAKIIIRTGEIPTTYNVAKYTNISPQSDVLSCPKCGSTSVTTGARGYSLVWGFAGSNKTVNRYGKCGYKWEPKKR